jgi:hypothetical protein
LCSFLTLHEVIGEKYKKTSDKQTSFTSCLQELSNEWETSEGQEMGAIAPAPENACKKI